MQRCNSERGRPPRRLRTSRSCFMLDFLMYHYLCCHFCTLTSSTARHCLCYASLSINEMRRCHRRLKRVGIGQKQMSQESEDKPHAGGSRGATVSSYSKWLCQLCHEEMAGSSLWSWPLELATGAEHPSKTNNLTWEHEDGDVTLLAFFCLPIGSLFIRSR